MKWFKIDKTQTKQPEIGMYNDWKALLADEGRHQCVYCAIPEASFGGIRNFHVEHYRPKSNEEFKHLKNAIANLFYACPVCNTFKGDDWPCSPPDNLSVPCYADPSVVDYNYIFLRTGSLEIEGANQAARYMVEKLYLNRPQLIQERRQAYLQQRLTMAAEEIGTLFSRLSKLNG